MSTELTVLLAFLAGLNPAAAALAAGRPVPWRIAGAAAGFAAVVVSIAILVAEPALEALDVSTASFRVATGIVMIVSGVVASLRLWPRLAASVPLTYREGIYPLGIPALLGPAVLVIGVSASANEGMGIAFAGAALALAVGAGALIWGPRAAFGTVSLFTAALLIVLAVAEIVAGVKQV